MLNISFQSILHDDNTSRSDCSRMQSGGEHIIGQRHLVSLSNSNMFKCFSEDGKSLILSIQEIGEDQAGFPEEHQRLQAGWRNYVSRI